MRHIIKWEKKVKPYIIFVLVHIKIYIFFKLHAHQNRQTHTLMLDNKKKTEGMEEEENKWLEEKWGTGQFRTENVTAYSTMNYSTKKVSPMNWRF